jgi:hypothetical protein
MPATMPGEPEPGGAAGSGGGVRPVPTRPPPAEAGAPAEPSQTPPMPAGLPDRTLAPVSGLRRLTADEYDRSVAHLLVAGVPESALLLPEDVRNPFDNDFTQQVASKALIEGVELLARDVTSALLLDSMRLQNLVGCQPTGPSDSACLRQFITRFGRRALRRPLSEQEIQRYLGFQSLAVMGRDFNLAVDAVIRALLQDPEFLYRVEIGQPVAGAPGIFKLGPWEMATRLSYFLRGTTPDEPLLRRAQAGGLTTAADVRAAAAEILGRPANRRQIARFHALWMGYEQLPFAPNIASAMKKETNTLLERVIFEKKRPWQEIFLHEETFVSDLLATHYGLSPPGSKEPVWVPYGASGRRGILSHGSFLSVGAKFEDTSPVQRGFAIRERLLCQTIPPPPDNVNVDDDLPPTTTSACKWDRYEAHRTGGCAACHQLLDPLGFGLERFDAEGRYRTHDKDRPECPIRGEGEIVGIGTFRGPAELGALLASAPAVTECAVTQLYRFAMGRAELDEVDQQFVAALIRRLGTKPLRFDTLLLDFVSSEAFLHRREER